MKKLRPFLLALALSALVLTPTSSSALLSGSTVSKAPVASPGNTQGNGPCTTSGSSNSQLSSTKNTNKACGYNLGDTGPAGGTVFYYSSGGFSCGPTNAATCHYLEVAPASWAGGSEPFIPWAASGNTTTNITSLVDDPGATPNNTLIGLGYYNSIQAVGQNGVCASVGTCTYAAGAARAYAPTVSGITYTDWYLPNVSELNQLCKYASSQAWTSDATVCTGANPMLLGMHPDERYWSSTESNADYRSWVQYMDSGGQFPGAYKGETAYVRPIRSF